MRSLPSLLLFALVLLLLVDFVAYNTEEVSLALWPLPDALAVPLFLVVLAALGLGLMLGRISLWPRHWRLKSEHRRQARQVKSLEADLARASPPNRPAGRVD